MLWSMKNLDEYTILTTDGERKPLLTTLFDEATWECRYLIVKPEGFSPTPVMIAFTAMNSPNRVAHTLPVELTAQQVKNSPTIVMNMLMTPSTQQRLNACYTLYQYWALSGYATSSLPVALISSPELPQPEATIFHDTRELLTMTVSANDGDIGTVHDLIVADDAAWAIRYLVINSNLGELGQIVWIPPELTESVNWKESRIVVDISLDQVDTELTTQPQGV